MPTDFEKVCLWGKTGNHGLTVKTALLTPISDIGTQCLEPIVCPFSVAVAPQSARLQTVDDALLRGAQ
jgi:hypothetical protein